MTARHFHTVRKHTRIASALCLLAAGSAAAQRSAAPPILQGQSAVPAAPMGPPPAGATVSGTPTLARVTWGLTGASYYTVQRWMQSDPGCCRATSPDLGVQATSWDDPVDRTGTYVYRVTAVYPDGRQGSVDLTYVRPEPANPAWLSAAVTKRFYISPKGYTPGYTWIEVHLGWPRVPGAAYYGLWGPGLPASGIQVNDNDAAHGYLITNGTSWGVNTWTVAAFFLPGPVGTPPANWTKGSVDIPAPKP